LYALLVIFVNENKPRLPNLINLTNIYTESVEIPTRCSFVIGFIIPKFFEGSTCFERHTAHHQEL